MLYRIITIQALLVLVGSCLIAQDVPADISGSKKAQKLYADAIELRKESEFPKANQKLEDALKEDPRYVEASMKLAEWYYTDEKPADAARAFEYTVAVDSFYKSRVLYSLGRIYLTLGEYTRSRILLQRFIDKGNPDKQLREHAEKYHEKAAIAEEFTLHPVDFQPEPIPGQVNTADDETLPALTIDGEYMLLTRRIRGQEDMYITMWDAAAKVWLPPSPLSAVNTLNNEGAHAVSADGSMIAFTANGRSDGAGSSDIYFWQRKDGVWLRPMNAGGINSPAWDAQPALTPDGNGLYFSSERPGGLGGKDIWYTERHGDLWTKPVNLGAPINTPGNEETPFLYYDGRTLYFISDGLPGLGDSDLFVTTRQGNTWTTPKNLGYPINTFRREGALTIHPNREYAYYTAEVEGDQYDIYRFRLDSTLLPPPVSNLTGVVFDATTNKPIVAHLHVFDLSDSLDTYQYNYVSDSEGVFSAVLVHGHTFGVHAEAKGYVFWSGQFALDSTLAYGKQTLRIGLTPVASPDITVGKTVVLRNIEFETGSATLRKTSLTELRRLEQLLTDYPEIHIEVRGHTDNVGDPADNKVLSENRARAVSDWLVAQGIDASRLAARGYGETIPAASNDTPDGRQENRRVEFVIRK